MWKTRKPPTPLDFDAIVSETFEHRAPSLNGAVNGTASTSVTPPSDNNGQNGQVVLKDQRKLSLKDNLELFVSRFVP